MADWALSPLVVRFARQLRGEGLAVGAAETQDALRALAAVPLVRHDTFRAALRLTLAKDPEARRIFDRLFAVFWSPLLQDTALSGEADEQTGEPVPEPQVAAPGGTVALPATGEPVDKQAHGPATGASHQARRMRRDFAAVDDQELAEMRDLVRLIARRLARRVGRRWGAARRGPPDLRASLRRALARGGELLEIKYRRRRRQRPRLVVVADVSYSMAGYSRFFLQFIYAFQSVFRSMETFVFSTRLSRVTPALQRGGLDEALRALSDEVTDWAGGTRIGASLASLVNDYGDRCLGRDTVVLIVSDGWDTGPPGELDAQLERIRRVSHRLIWLDPLAGHPGYFASAAGPHRDSPWVDHCLPARDLASLRELAATLERLPIS